MPEQIQSGPFHGPCPACGSAEIVRLTPSIPGPDGWGGRCKACGMKWSCDEQEDPMPEQIQQHVPATEVTSHLVRVEYTDGRTFVRRFSTWRAAGYYVDALNQPPALRFPALRWVILPDEPDAVIGEVSARRTGVSP